MTSSELDIDLGQFMTDYVLYAKELTDAPVDFHLIMAKNILANVIGKRVYIEFASGRQYLNQYSIVVAPPSARKTSVYT